MAGETSAHFLRTLAARAWRSEHPEDHTVCLETAHPSKFESIVEPLLQRPLPVPPALAALLERPASADPTPADYPTLRSLLLANG